MPQNCTSGSFLGLFCIHKYTSIIVLTPFRFLGKHPILIDLIPQKYLEDLGHLKSSDIN
jgi:hypothetical protein